MNDLIGAVRAKADRIRATVVTRTFQFDGELHCPKTGKDARRLSNLLNSDRNFIAMTSVTVTNRQNGAKDPTTHKYLQISLQAVEFVKPHDEEEDEESSHPLLG